MKHVPFAQDLEDELAGQASKRRKRETAEGYAGVADEDEDSIAVNEARELSDEESLTVRKILACAARMGGRFGKGMLASVLRGSRSAKLAQAGLDQLSTYGILAGLTQDEILLYVDALLVAGCLQATGGAYPTVAVTQMGGEVMRERATVRLALPSPARGSSSNASLSTRAASHRTDASAPKRSTVDETYALYEQGLNIEEICAQRGLTEMTVEKHLAECILEGRAFDLSKHVGEADRALIESAVEQLGAERLKPLRDALPHHINYRMIRFVVAEMLRAAGLGTNAGDSDMLSKGE